ncbi:P-loop containing nucleoside triphosphate hydrolase protein [Polyplosphaeria fusca]|uniref:P-loop containing nucleoside triphosphate hydrolase protein n=1 Tax=Polyplosphaeria fusca TaxID=682080 RepID=A0A9P4UYL9_9PLEO|nr:P-loop containing nucleoside triphosphate hydrolase protein [Polyplosphaeria fusca]
MQYTMPKRSHFEPTSSTDRTHSQKLSELEYRLCTPQVRGFELSSNAWGTFYVDGVHDINFSTEAFPRLVLPYDYKELLLAFVASQLSCDDTFDDVIQGKGRGMIILLHGNPGLGKTLTAEATAEELRRPLYAVSAGELGYSAGEVESKLRKVLEISTKWGAVLLIDECDIFLEQRTVSDIERNKIVAVFLRLLDTAYNLIHYDEMNLSAAADNRTLQNRYRFALSLAISVESGCTERLAERYYLGGYLSMPSFHGRS